MEETKQDVLSQALVGQTQWVYFEINNGWYALPVERVRELIQTPNLVKVPKVPDYILGVITLREITLPVIDLRLRLGMPSLTAVRDKMIATMRQRKQDHIDWLDALKNHVRTGAEFTKALDPRKCAFGQWFETFHTDDLTLGSLVPKFEAPHKSIHAIGAEVIRLTKEGKGEEAQQTIDRTEHGSLAEMLKLFDQMIEHLHRQESQVTVVTELEHGVCGLLVDKVESVITFEKGEVGPKPAMSSGGKTTSDMVIGVARPKSFKERMILLLDPDRGLGGEDLAKLAALGRKEKEDSLALRF
jgi:purine-binding chemotaxis protein CheW